MLPLCHRLNKLPGLPFQNYNINHISYCDDFILLALNNLHAQLMVNICYEFGKEYNIKWNATKTYVIRFIYSKRSSIAKSRTYSPLGFTQGSPFTEVDNEKWLGYVLCADLSDDKHIQTQTCRIYCATNRILDNIRPRFLDRKTKRALINAFGCIYLVGTFNNFTQKSWRALQSAHRYLVRNITGMFCRGNMLIDVDPHPYFQEHELTGVQQMFENGGIFPDVRSRWPYTEFNLLTIYGLRSKALHRLSVFFQ